MIFLITPTYVAVQTALVPLDSVFISNNVLKFKFSIKTSKYVTTFEDNSYNIKELINVPFSSVAISEPTRTYARFKETIYLTYLLSYLTDHKPFFNFTFFKKTLYLRTSSSATEGFHIVTLYEKKEMNALKALEQYGKPHLIFTKLTLKWKTLYVDDVL